MKLCGGVGMVVPKIKGTRVLGWLATNVMKHPCYIVLATMMGQLQNGAYVYYSRGCSIILVTNQPTHIASRFGSAIPTSLNNNYFKL